MRYSSHLSQTIYRAGLDGRTTVYVFTVPNSMPLGGFPLAAGSGVGPSVTPSSQEEGWILDELADDYGLTKS